MLPLLNPEEVEALLFYPDEGLIIGVAAVPTVKIVGYSLI